MSDKYPGGFVTDTAPVQNPALGAATNGIWTMDQAAYAAKNRTWAMYDPQFSGTTLLLHGNGTNGAQNNTFLDSSSNNFTITRNGNTTQGTFSPYGSLWSNYFNGSTDYLSFSSGFTASTGDYTVEFFAYKTSTWSATCDFLDAATNGLCIYTNSSGSLYVTKQNVAGTSVLLGSLSSLAINTWYHIAVIRSSGNVRCYVNGVPLQAAVADSNTYSAASSKIGGTSDGYFAGYISNYRITNTVVYSISSSTITVPTSPLTAISGTQLLTCQSNRFVDSSSVQTVSVGGGSPSVQRFSPFKPNQSYTPEIVGGSGYFDGSGDYLSIADNAALQFSNSTVFTVEAWVYPAAVSAQQGVIVKRGSSGTQEWGLLISSTGTAMFSGNSSNLIGSTALKANSWNHIAASSDGTTVSIFSNGVRDGTATATSLGITSSTNAVLIGYQTTAANPFTGYVTDARVIKGTQIYSGTTYTIPTAPETAITNTSLLCNMTNAGISDSAMMNDLETVGDAQVSTSVKKYGTGSMYFDGTGDYLVAKNAQAAFSFGTGDFTIECWAYYNAIGSDQGIVDCRAVGSGLANWILNVQPGGVVDFIYGATRLRTAGLFSTGSWVHIAVTRASGTIRIFVNGVNSASATYTSAIDAGTATPNIGRATDPAYMNGYIDDLRITKGVARYTAAFTPPTSQLQDF